MFGTILLVILLVIFITETLVKPLIEFIKLIPSILREFWKLLEVISPIFPLYQAILLAYSALLIIAFPFRVCFANIKSLYLQKRNFEKYKKHIRNLRQYCSDIEDEGLLSSAEFEIKNQIQHLSKVKHKRKIEIIKDYEECLNIIDYKRGKIHE